MPTEKIIVINSRDKISGTNSNFTIQLQDSISQEVLKILVKDVFVPNQFYNVDGDNNTLDLNQNSLGVVQAIVPAGQYNIDEPLPFGCFLQCLVSGHYFLRKMIYLSNY